MGKKRLAFLTIVLFCASSVFLLLYLCTLPAFKISSMSLTTSAGYERLFSDNIAHHITINITQAEWNGLIEDMKDYGKVNVRMKTENYRVADFIYEDKYGRLEIDGVGFRTRGNTTRILPEDDVGKYHRAHFSIRFDETFDLPAGTAEYTELKRREFCGLEKLNLKWNLWVDKSHIRELYCFEQLNAAGIMAPLTSLSTLIINIEGEKVYYGVYTVIEPIDKNFLTRRFGKKNNDGNLYKCLWENTCATLDDGYPEGSIGVKDWEKNYRPAYDLKTNETTGSTSDLVSFIESINRLNDEDFAVYIDKMFDVDGFLRLLAMNTLLGTCDDYRTMGNNYYLYFSNAGMITMIPYDYDASLGGGWGGEPHWTSEGIADADIYAWFDLSAAFLGEDVSRPLLDRILNIKEHRERYEFYLQSFIDDEVFSYRSYQCKFTDLKRIYGAYASSGTEDHGEEMLLTNEEWYFKTKTESVKRQLG